MIDDIVAFFKQHPQLVPVEDFEVAVQDVEKTQKRFFNGQALLESDERHLWVQLKLRHRNKPGIASATVVNKEVLDKLVISALENADRSHPDPWFRFPVWSRQGLSLTDQQNLKSRSTLPFSHSSDSEWEHLSEKCPNFQEHYETSRFSTTVFRRSEKERRSCFGHTIFQSWDLEGIKDFWWGPVNRIERLKKSEALLTLVKAAERKEIVAPVPVVSLAPRASALLLSQVGKWFSAKSIHQGESPLSKHSIGEDLFSKSLSVWDDGDAIPTPRAVPFDLEGIRTQKTALIHQGTVAGFLYDAQFGAMNNSKSTGNSFRAKDSYPHTELLARAMSVEAGHQNVADHWKSEREGFAVEWLTKSSFVNQTICVADAVGWIIKAGKKEAPAIVRGLELDVWKILRQSRGVSCEAETLGAVRSPAIFLGEFK